MNRFADGADGAVFSFEHIVVPCAVAKMTHGTTLPRSFRPEARAVPGFFIPR